MISNSKIFERGTAMKKALSILVALAFIFAVSQAYACGEKNTTAKATKADASGSSSSCCAGKVKATVSNGEAVSVEPAVVQNTEATSTSCTSEMKAAAQKTGAGAKYCPASSDCPHPCYREGADVNKMKAEKKVETKADGMASAKAVAAPEADNLK